MDILATMFKSVAESYAMCRTVSQYVELTALLTIMTAMTLIICLTIGFALFHAPIVAAALLVVCGLMLYITLHESGYYND